MTKLRPSAVRELLDYNPETGELFWKARSRKWFASDRDMKKWNTRYSGAQAFTFVDKIGRKRGAIFDQTFFAHRVIWAHVHGEWPDLQIDHINGQPSDNRLINLRLVTNAENGRNAKRSSRNKTGVTGVWMSGKIYVAEIRVNNVKINLGRWPTLEQARAARKAAEIAHGFHPNHGRAALLRVPYRKVEEALR